jgi:hypothetical protein
MRAIIECITSKEPTDLKEVLEENSWLPTIGEDDEFTQSRKIDIIEHIAPEDQPLVEKTFLHTIYDDSTKTWGIVNRPTKYELAIRLKNSSSEKLKHACEKLVGDLQVYSLKYGKNLNFQFPTNIVVLEPNSNSPAFHGEVLPLKRFPRRFFLAIQERKREALVSGVALLISLILLVLTIPTWSSLIPFPLESDWHKWIAGNLERFGTATLLTSAISGFEVFLHWFDIRRKPIIRWLV